MGTRRGFGWALVSLVTGLGGSLGCSSDRPGGSQGDAGGPPAIVRVEVSPTSLLLTGAGQSHPMTAQAFDSTGKEVAASFVWTSSRPSQIAVDASGRVQAVSTLGSAMVYAEVGEIRSREVPVASVEPRPGALLLTDSQVVGPGTWSLADAGSGPPVGLLDVRLRNVQVPAAGTVVLSTESAGVAGVVVSARQDGGEVVVQLEAVALPRLLDRYDLKWSLPLADGEIVMDAPGPPHMQQGDPFRRTGALERQIEKSFPPSGPIRLTCSGAASASLDVQGPQASLEGDAHLVYESSKEDATLPPGYFKLAVVGSLYLKTDLTVKAQAGLSGAAQCELAGTIPVPIPFAILPGVRIGVGVSVSGKLEVASLELGLMGENGLALDVGVVCGPDPAPCQVLDTATPINRLTPSLKVPAPSEEFKLELTAQAYFLAGLDALVAGGLADLRLIKATVGPVQKVLLMPPKRQADDPAEASEYSLRLEGQLGAGEDLASAIEAVTDIEAGALSVSAPIGGGDLGHSPLGNVTVDRTSVAPQNPVRFTFDFSTVSYPVIGYNIEESGSVEIFRKREGAYESMQTVAMSSTNQAIWTWTPTSDDVGTNEFFAFVKSKLLPLSVLELELGKDSRRTVEVVGICTAQGLSAALRAGDLVAASDCRLAGTLEHRAHSVADIPPTDVLVVDRAAVTMSVDVAGSIAGLIAFQPSGTWSMQHSGSVSSCILSFPDTTGSFTGAQTEGRITLQTGEGGGVPGLYSGGLITPTVQVTESLTCEGQTITQTLPQSDPLFLVTPEQGFVVDLDGGVAQGTYTTTAGASTETWTWDLVLSTQGGAAVR